MTSPRVSQAAQWREYSDCPVEANEVPSRHYLGTRADKMPWGTKAGSRSFMVT